MMCACGRGTPGRKPDPGVCPTDDDHGPAGGHCACCHEPDGDADRHLPVSGAPERLAAVMPEHQSWCQAEVHGDCCGASDCDCGVADSLDRLLPVVQALVAEGQAEALPGRSEAHYAGMQAVREMASDWYCPRSKPGRHQRRDCPECVAEVALDAALAHVYGDALRATEATTC